MLRWIIFKKLAIFIFFLLVSPLNLRSAPSSAMVTATLTDGELLQELKIMRMSSPNKPMLFNRFRHDGAGATVANLLYAAAYAEHRNWLYAGAVGFWVKGKQSNHKHMVDVPGMAEYIFGRPILFQVHHLQSLNCSVHQTNFVYERCAEAGSSCLENVTGPPWPADVIWFDSYNMHKAQDLYPTEHLPLPSYRMAAAEAAGGTSASQLTLPVARLDYMMSGAFLSRLRRASAAAVDAQQLLFEKGVPSVAIHMRRGDVTPADRIRYTPNEYYIDIVRQIRSAVSTPVQVHVFSSLEGQHAEDEFKPLREQQMHVHLEQTVQAKQSWAHFAKANILIMAKSAFSSVPALLREKCVIYEPYHMGKLSNWVTADQLNATYIQHCLSMS